MKRCVALLPLVLAFAIGAGGCNPPPPVAAGGGSAAPPAPPPPPPPPPGSEPASAATAAPEQSPAAATPLPPEAKVGAFAGTIDDLAAGPRTAPAATVPPSQPPTEVVKAEKGVGLKGRSLDPYEGALVTPAKAYFAAKERIAFEIEVPHALALYEATNGEGPKSHEQFMKEIIEANRIKLPVLPPGHEYLYDPEAKQLMVKRPKQP